MLFRGKSFKRGYMYSYSLSKQGRSYVTWLRRGKPIEDVYYTQLTYQVNSCLPEELRDHLSALSLIRSNRRYRGPVRNLRLFDNSAVPVACLILQNQSLASENQSVSTENLKLAVDNLKLRQMVEKEQSEKNALLLAYAAAVAEAANSKNTAEQWKRIAEEYFKALQSEKENTQKISPPNQRVHILLAFEQLKS